MRTSTTSDPVVPASRRRLSAVLNEAGDVVRIDDVVNALEVSRAEAAKLLSRWVEQAWLRRAARGVYLPASLTTLDSIRVLDDPWILVPPLFDPAYIGGRTAAEHWDLTEQIFRDIVVMTAQTVRQKSQRRHGAEFSLTHVRPEKIFGTTSVWRGRTRVAVADVHRTILDMLADPALGGGIQHVADSISVYLKSDDRDDDLLIRYAVRLGNGAVFKRLGFLAERSATGAGLSESCRQHLTAGHAKLDPALECPRLVTRWRLRVPETWSPRNRTWSAAAKSGHDHSRCRPELPLLR